MVIWGTQVSMLQFTGYGIALTGLIYYKLGGDQLKSNLEAARLGWAGYGARYPIARRVTVLVGTLLVFIIILGGLAPTYAPSWDPVAWLANLQKSSTGGV
jgi:hypothetical protein